MQELLEFEVRTTWVRRYRVRHRVFAKDKKEAIALVIARQGQRVDRSVQMVERPSYRGKKWVNNG